MSWKKRIFELLGRDPDPVVVSFLTGPEDLALGMLREVRELLPDYRHFAVSDQPMQIEGVEVLSSDRLGELRRKRIGMAPVLFTQDPRWRRLRRAALHLAPLKILAYNEQLERHHLRPSTWIASLLFLNGVPLDRIWLRPRWLFPWRRDRSVAPSSYSSFEGRPLDTARPRVAVLSPYFPYPMSHGGAVRIFNLLREGSKHFDIYLFSFTGKVEQSSDVVPVASLCAQVFTVMNPRYREPRWSTLLPPEALEFDVPVMRRLIHDIRRQYGISLLQVEYTQLGSYGGDILVEHDVTFDLYRQIHGTERRLRSWWNLWRWRRFEKTLPGRYRAVVTMSGKDAALLGAPNVRVIPNGVDLNRFEAEPEPEGSRVLFVGSFRHFPNVAAYRFLVDEIWPAVRAGVPGAHLTVVAGPEPERYCRIDPEPSVTIHAFVADVRPLYAEANLVVVPTKASAGTNLKVLEAMAMRRAIVSTSSGCAGLGLTDGVNVTIADHAEEFARQCVRLLADPVAREGLSLAARSHCEKHFDWTPIGRRQRELWEDLLGKPRITVRDGTEADLPLIELTQDAIERAVKWDSQEYLQYNLRVAERAGQFAGFMVFRELGREREILNLAVAPEHRRMGVATALIQSLGEGTVLLEVRESNAAGRALYRSLGFIETGRRPGYYRDPEEAAILMQRG